MKWFILVIVLIGIFAFAYNDVVDDYSKVVDKYEDVVYDNYNLSSIIEKQEQAYGIIKIQNLNVTWKYELESNKTEKLNIELESLEESNAILKAKIDKLNSFRLDLTPSIFEVRDFLARDSTDINSYVFESYDCTHFAHEVVRNSLFKGIFACTVEMDIGDGGHILVAFNTSERGVVYFEPQTDKEVTLRIGKKYWTSNNHDAVTYNDTIERWDSCFGYVNG